MACATVVCFFYPSDTVISLRFPDSASRFTVEILAILKPRNKLNIQVHQKYIILSHFCVSTAHSVLTQEHPWFYVGIMGNRKNNNRISWYDCSGCNSYQVYHLLSLNVILDCILFCPSCKMIGTVRLRTRFILLNQSWEIGMHPTGSGLLLLWARIGIHIWPIHTSWDKIHFIVKILNTFWQFSPFLMELESSCSNKNKSIL